MGGKTFWDKLAPETAPHESNSTDASRVYALHHAYRIDFYDRFIVVVFHGVRKISPTRSFGIFLIMLSRIESLKFLEPT